MTRKNISEKLDKIEEVVEELREEIKSKEVRTRGDPIVELH